MLINISYFLKVYPRAKLQDPKVDAASPQKFALYRTGTVDDAKLQRTKTTCLPLPSRNDVYTVFYVKCSFVL